MMRVSRRAAAQLARAAQRSAAAPPPHHVRGFAHSSAAAAPPASRVRAGLAAGAAVAAALACAASAALPAQALRGGDAPPPSDASSLSDAPSAAQLEALHAWLRARGAEVSSVAVAPCAGDPAAGLGVYVTAPPSGAAAWLPRVLRPGWWLGWPGRTLAEFPLDSVITATSCTREPAAGKLYARWWQARRFACCACANPHTVLRVSLLTRVCALSPCCAARCAGGAAERP
jgi:hypothetical protein